MNTHNEIEKETAKLQLELLKRDVNEKTKISIFDIQIDLLKKEIEINKSTIAQMHEFGKTIKNWGIVLWATAIGGALTDKSFTKYIIFIIAIPLLLWFVEAAYRKIQSKFLYRWGEIKSFVNSENFIDSKVQGKFIDFEVLDLLGTDKKNSKYKKMTSWRRIIIYKSLYIFYGSLSIFTIAIWIMTFFLKF